MIYCPLGQLRVNHQRWQGKWGTTVRVAHVLSILAVVGIWAGPKSQDIYVLRKHPGLDLLSQVECGLGADEVDGDTLEGTAAYM